MPEQQIPSTDILRLFREDLSSTDRVEAFKQSAEQLREQVDQLASPENVAIINECFDLNFIFNSHGGAINAGQSIRAANSPFITFVENAGDEDISQNALFNISLNNAFEMTFHKSSPLIPLKPADENSWGYWRDRGLMGKGSIVAPIDIRHYSKRLLDALMGSDYDQNYLNQVVPNFDLQNKPYEEVLEEQKQKGHLIMYSNAVRELTSTKQVIETLLDCIEARDGPGFSDDTSIKMRALVQEQRMRQDKLNAYVIYGTAHHSMMHIFNRLGIQVGRQFPGKDNYKGAISFAGTTQDQFFSAHPFGLSDEQTVRYAEDHIAESLLWVPLNNPAEYGVVPEDFETVDKLYLRISRIARAISKEKAVSKLFEEHKNSPTAVVDKLVEHGIKLVPIA